MDSRALFLMVVVGAVCVLQAEGAITVVNSLSNGVAVELPPGCCSPCDNLPPGRACIEECVPCPSAYLAAGEAAMLHRKVEVAGEFMPLRIRTSANSYHCIFDERINGDHTLVVGPARCGYNGIQGSVDGVKFCLAAC